MSTPHILRATHVFDGQRLHDDLAVVVEDDRITALIPGPDSGAALLPGTLAPAFIDLQVNGGGGHLVCGQTTVQDLHHICATHRRLGCAGVMPTLITDTPEATAHVIRAGTQAARAGVQGFLGLHLEGPHLDPRRHGAHNPAFIRPMLDSDLEQLCAAARALPALIVTLAPEAATPAQIAKLSAAGAVVSLGHSDCSYDAAQTGFAAGAHMATHLFNAMSPLGHRSPGLAGAVLSGGATAGLIADGFHVHPAVMQVALAARGDGIFLVTDCMSFAGTGLSEMQLNGRRVLRRDGRLTLEDGTLAGADLTLDAAIARLISLGIPPERALAMASRIPAEAIGQQAQYGSLAPGRQADIVLLGQDWRLQGHWSGSGWL